ncbi:hypothetical protein GYMLUDRAFT_36767 [Collybiopsis luxurians FD-317 M1]|nr:hypothetical protein GYMLUDRAFT_36767 [Collybiopsis luxurians FD-317 M1]
MSASSHISPSSLEKKRKHSGPESTAEFVKKKKKKQKQGPPSPSPQEVDHSVETPRVQRKKKSNSDDAASSVQNNDDAEISSADLISVIRIAAATTSPSDLSQQLMSGRSLPSIPQYSYGDLLSGDNSSDAVLKAIQGIDVRGLSTGSSSSRLSQAGIESTPGAPQSSTAVSSQLKKRAHRPASSQIPASVGRTKTAESASGSTHNQNLENLNTEESAELLATRWLPSRKLVELAKTRGLIYKKGKFSKLEEQQLNSAIEHYANARQLNVDQLHEVIFPKEDKPRDNAFWSEITRAVPQRHVVSVYHHVRRSHHPLKQQGKWLPAEDQKLKEAVATVGQQWEKVSLLVGRRGPDCRDRWRNHIVGREVRVSGAWSPEEEEELTRIVEEMTVKQGGTLDDDLFWGRVSDLMGNKRNRQQCRIKWTDSLCKRIKSNGNQPRWSNQDAYILVHKLDSLHVRDDSEIDWKTLPDGDWNLWSAHVLQRRWLTMKRSIKGHEEMSMQEIMEILKAKKTNIDPTPEVSRTKKKSKNYPSAEMVDSDGED